LPADHNYGFGACNLAGEADEEHASGAGQAHVGLGHVVARRLSVEFVLMAATVCVAVGFVIQRNRQYSGNAPLRSEIEARVCFETTLDRLSKLGTNRLGGTRGMWLSVRGPKQLTVGTDAFMISAPWAFREWAFTGRGSSIAVTQMPSRLAERVTG
jgi:hypothetical protein